MLPFNYFRITLRLFLEQVACILILWLIYFSYKPQSLEYKDPFSPDFAFTPINVNRSLNLYSDYMHFALNSLTSIFNMNYTKSIYNDHRAFQIIQMFAAQF